MVGRRKMSTSGNSTVISSLEYHSAGVQSTKNGEEDWKKKLPSTIGHLPLVQSFFGILSTICWTVNWPIFAFLAVASTFFNANFFKNNHVFWDVHNQLVVSLPKQKNLLTFVIILCLIAASAGAENKTGNETGRIQIPAPLVIPRRPIPLRFEWAPLAVPLQVPKFVSGPLGINVTAPAPIAIAYPIPNLVKVVLSSGNHSAPAGNQSAVASAGSKFAAAPTGNQSAMASPGNQSAVAAAPPSPLTPAQEQVELPYDPAAIQAALNGPVPPKTVFMIILSAGVGFFACVVLALACLACCLISCNWRLRDYDSF